MRVSENGKNESTDWPGEGCADSGPAGARLRTGCGPTSTTQVHPAGYEPMLASGGPIRQMAGFAVEPKLDGWRAVCHVTGAGLSIYTRPGREISSALPELTELAEVLPVGTVLDGELVAGSGRSSSFYRLGGLLATRPALRRPRAVTFVALTSWPYTGTLSSPSRTRTGAGSWRDSGLLGSTWCTVSQWTDVSEVDLLAVCERVGVEGMVAKRLGSRYRPGERSLDWVKLKTTAWRAIHGPYRHR